MRINISARHILDVDEGKEPKDDGWTASYLEAYHNAHWYAPEKLAIMFQEITLKPSLLNAYE
ncbi:hypothetical protein [Eudoraea sp.]|uniref:hypothetical protein n=1 Tax=Eudoraea sp. TaxID=1979955 RepID=UPI003C7874DC